METLIYLFIGISIIVIYQVFFVPPELRIKHLEPLIKESRAARQKKAIKLYFGHLFPFTRALLGKLGIEKGIKERLNSGHVALKSEEFFNIKLFFLIVCMVIAYFITKRFDPLFMFMAVVIGYFGPDLWLKQKIKARRNAIVKVLPETVDLLSLCVEGGLDFTMSIKWVIDKKISVNPLIEELSSVLEEIKWGKPRTQALKDMSRRLNAPEISTFVHTLVQAERMGTPVAEAFTILSEDTRLQRFHRGERIAMQAPLKILFPLIFCILPVIGIIIGGPILLQFMQGGGLPKGFGG